MLRLNVDKLRQAVTAYNGIRIVGKLRSARGLLTATLPAAVGDICQIGLTRNQSVLAEVIGFDSGVAQIMAYDHSRGLHVDAPVTALSRKLRVPVGHELLGRVIDGIGRPIDGLGPLETYRKQAIYQDTPPPLDRPRIQHPFITGQRVVDGLLTCGQGQRVGLFAGSGVGKSTLLGDIAKGATSDLNVIALIGERGREVRPFLDDYLGAEGLRRSVVVIASSDQAPLMRIRAAHTAVTIADDFRRQGANVLFLLDSLTRLAMAQREIGLLLGEPPTARGYTPSVFQLLSHILEQLGCTPDGSITGILTVLVDGDELDEPLSDAVRAIVDGHIVLDRSLAQKSHFPAVNIGESISRVFRDVTESEHQRAALKLRSILTTYNEAADLIRIGAYTQGSSPQIDRAIRLLPVLERFLKQDVDECSPFEETRRAMDQIAAAWPY